MEAKDKVSQLVHNDRSKPIFQRKGEEFKEVKSVRFF